jgi:hypothetical protein
MMDSEPDIIEYDCDLDSPLVFWGFELESLYEVFLISEQLLRNHIINQEIRSKASEQLALSTLDDEESRYEAHCENRMEWQSKQEMFGAVYKRHFRNHFLVALCSIYETGLQHLANHLCEKKRLTPDCDVRNKGRQSANRYFVEFFRRKLDIEIFAQNHQNECIMENAFSVRNIVAHRNSVPNGEGRDEGALSQLGPYDTEVIEDFGIFGLDDVLVLTTSYLEKIFAIVKSVFDEINRHDLSLLAIE